MEILSTTGIHWIFRIAKPSPSGVKHGKTLLKSPHNPRDVTSYSYNPLKSGTAPPSSSHPENVAELYQNCRFVGFGHVHPFCLLFVVFKSCPVGGFDSENGWNS